MSKSKVTATEYSTYRGLPPLAGLTTMARAVECHWSVEQSTERLKRFHYVLKCMYETLTARITAEPVYELKTAMSHHAYLCAEYTTAIRRRVSEMRVPPLGLDVVPHESLKLLMDEILAAPTTEELVSGVYEILVPALLEASHRLQSDAHPLADAPTVRLAKLMHFEFSEVAEFGKKAVACLISMQHRDAMLPWTELLRLCLASAGGVDGALSIEDTAPPQPQHSATPYQYRKEPKRDERFQDSYNAGVNPEAFLYDERFSPRDKTLMMYYKRLREIDVPEMMASILYDLRDEEPWEFHMEMSRQLWDEARHAMMGEVGFVSLGIDWSKIPINFTWSRNLNLQLDARERHGVLFFIEQGLMPRTGKRYEWEVGRESGDGLSGMFQDFDWADEVLHAQIGRRWYVPRYKSLQEALAYGDRCWTKVMSGWHAYRDQGLTTHRNWWPDLYLEACERWNVPPDPLALSYNTTYEDSRADLQRLTS
ncbi:MAG: hypothetical protein NTY15_05045 [Planctomycetota bacterium]|nr:hypothetical protein [Planctomycetota bacterium]